MHDAISIRRLVVQYGARRVVDGLDLTIAPGCVYALLGGNGAGKTTTINALLGFVRPSSGQILIGGSALAMLLDEPTSGLDPAAANDFAVQIRAAAGRGIAVLMATHDLFNARQVADRIGIMKHGRLVAEVAAARIGHPELEALYLQHARVAA